jgi:hypothetical protein
VCWLKAAKGWRPMFDNRKIIIHEFMWRDDIFPKEAQMKDVKIVLYYINEHYYYWNFIPEENRKEGYVILVKIKAVRKPKIVYITKDYFEEIYKEFERMNFEFLACQDYTNGDYEKDGLEIQMGISDGYNKYVKKLTLDVPFYEYQNDEQPELSKLIKIIMNIKDKITGYDQWYSVQWKEWYEWNDKNFNYEGQFYYSNDNVRDLEI